MATIVILEHAFQGHSKETYLLYDLVKRWQRWGHTVKRHRGLGDSPAADVAILNVDLTVIPDEYLAVAARYPTVVNGAVRDISKRRFSQVLVDRDTDYPGPVIVKTNANARGTMDRFIAQQVAANMNSAPPPRGTALRHYRTYPTVQQVPPDVWENPALIVEKFLPEQDERGYYSRHWSFFGDRESSTRNRALVSVIKSRDMVERMPVEVPDEIRQWRRRLKFDFGKFDYVKHGEGYLLLDVNTTPTVPAYNSPAVEAARDVMARGIDVFLPPARRIAPPETGVPPHPA